MRTFGFTTDIELRVPQTGKVFMIDRMTSDWAERHPLNVDQFIEDVYQEFAGTEFEESRESLRKVWTATLSMPVQGDKSVYPNNNGARRAAAMKIWMLAGDYWRRGLRLGDVLPERCPSMKITRLDDGGWIALSPKDMHLLDEIEGEGEVTEEIATAAYQSGTPLPLNFETEVEPAEHTGDSPSCDNSRAELAYPLPFTDITEGTVPVCSAPVRSQAAARRRSRREEREAQRRDYEARLAQEAIEAEKEARSEMKKKIFAAVGAAAVTLVMIHFFGLLGPAAFGLLAGGLLKG